MLGLNYSTANIYIHNNYNVLQKFYIEMKRLSFNGWNLQSNENWRVYFKKQYRRSVVILPGPPPGSAV